MVEEKLIDAVFQVNGYVTNGFRLYEVVAVSGNHVCLRNCMTDHEFTWPLDQLLDFVSVYPTCPDAPDSL